MEKSRVLSGIRATGRMHLGNYIGVMESAAAMTLDERNDCMFFVADLHSLTTLKDAQKIRQHAPNIVMDLIAAGVDPERATIYVQSQVPSVALIAWYLACLTPHGDLERMATFKEKASKHADDVNAGLYQYPVLMAADILGAKANYVPVGPDQRPHLELARELARRFNRQYKADLFPMPVEHTYEGTGHSVPGLVARGSDEKFAKMGKSEAPGQTLYLADSPADIESKIAKAPTDPARVHRHDPGDPKKCVIHELHSNVSTPEASGDYASACQAGTISCCDCKLQLAKAVNERLSLFRSRRAILESQPELLLDILSAGATRAQSVFDDTAARMGELMGVYRP